MASLPTTKVIVKNLPERWTPDFLLNYLEVTSEERLLVDREGVQVFLGITHSALLTLEEPVTAMTLQQAERLLASAPFQKTNVLGLEGIPSQTCSLLVHYSDPSVSCDLVLFYFDEPQQSGCGDGYVEDCQVYQELQLAVVRFSSFEAIEGVIAQGNHRLKKGGEVLKVEHWYEPFHRPLLQQLTSQRRPGPNPTVVEPCTLQAGSQDHRYQQVQEDRIEPAYLAPTENSHTVSTASHSSQSGRNRVPLLYNPPVASAAAAASTTYSQAEALNIEKLTQENERLKQMLAHQETKKYEERERLQQQRLLEKERQEELLLAEREAQQRFMAEQRAQSLRVEKERMQKSAEHARVETERLQQTQMENERLKSENEKLKNQTSTSLHVPAYKFRLLERFADQWTACKLMFLEHKEELMFYGTEEDCETEKLRVLKRLQDLADDALPLREPVAQILGTDRGRTYLADLVQKHWGCSAEVRKTDVLCAALSMEELEPFTQELRSHILRKICLVPATLTKSVQFQALRMKLEKEYMVMITCPVGDSEEVYLDGLKGDVGLATWEVTQFTNLNHSGSKKFVVSGALQGNACRNWFSAELDEVKQLIVRSGGEIEGETKEGEYILKFQCRQAVLAEVTSKLETISSSIVSDAINLTKEFPDYSEQALLVNGLYDMGVRQFSWHLVEKLRETGIQSAGDILLPERYLLPSFGLAKGGDQDRGNNSQSRERSPKRGHHQRPPGGAGCRRKGHRHGGWKAKGGKALSDLPYNVNVGGTQIIVKLGDITTEQVSAAVSVLGTDLNPKATAIGAAFLGKWPFLSSALVSNSGSERGAGEGKCRVLTTPIAKSRLPMSTLFHAVLSKLQRPADVSKMVKEVVLKILQQAAQQGMRSVAFPPLGVGRRFGFGQFTTASAMMSAFCEFLQANPASIESITVVVYNDVKVAGTFVKAMKQMLRKRGRSSSPSRTAPRSDSSSATSDSSDSDSSEDDDKRGRKCREKFEAVVCARRQEDCGRAKELLLKELRTVFLWHETLNSAQTQALLALPPPSLKELAHSAVERNVLLTISEKKKGVRLCGQRDRVQEMLLLILPVVQTGRPTQSALERSQRRKLHLPEDTDRLPSYWRVCRGNQSIPYDKAIESWKKRGMRMNSVSEEEQNAVRQLVGSTWELAKVGKGADAKNLSHSKIQVKRVERLENPKLWQRYSQRREQLFRSLLDKKRDGPAVCKPVENLPQSSGAVRTTQNINKRGPLNCDIFQQVNEHYLFHGTKTDTLSKICSEGLDFRLTGKGMLGRGNYLTESPTKADQYADPKGSRVAPGQELKILLVRVLLGEPYLHAGDAEDFSRPPCYFCRKGPSDCRCQEPHCFDSVVFDSSKIFREFVVYDRDVCYPEYVITYVRV